MAAQGVVADAISDSETAFQAEIEFQGYRLEREQLDPAVGPGGSGRYRRESVDCSVVAEGARRAPSIAGCPQTADEVESDCTM